MVARLVPHLVVDVHDVGLEVVGVAEPVPAHLAGVPEDNVDDHDQCS